MLISKTTLSFWKFFYKLPPDIQDLAKEKYVVWKNNPYHLSIQFKELYNGDYSARINIKYRALATKKDDIFYWYWIGSHADYDNLIK
jgi:hypothetical protein